MPAILILDNQVSFITDPVSPCAGQDFSVTWEEANVGDEDSADYQDIFDLDDQGTGESQALECDPLAAGESATRSLTFNLPAGDYTMTLIINGQTQETLGNVRIGDCV
ncbi:hypothetical protein H5398_08605 [Tessaracoccus sp. MC1679]|uniref:CARDB domain-containing protein n=1 Tax=unclassified Tessaracoccus TaxID=2635419 RepID=UPI0016007229|nr:MULTISPECIES: CARDB domain-containing protein [unclassified Tessaracoccus]MBB1512914.1 hypothetical protein [Tessaracoccus sp. MC1627]MBB1516025.1 hypothetical protein [Tessaracoccus sp. MC1679]